MIIIQSINRKIGDIVLDAITVEENTSEIDITENPIESGAVITDHYALKPKEVTITGVVAEQDPTKYMDFNLLNMVRSGDFMGLVQTVAVDPKGIIGIKDKLLEQGKAFLQSEVETIARPITNFLPDFVKPKYDKTTAQTRPQKTYESFLKIQKQGEPINITTGMMTYENMLLESVGASERPDGVIEFSITARQISIVETQTLKNSAAGKNRSGRAKAQGAKKSNSGKTQPKSSEKTKEKRRSMLSKVLS